MLRFKLGENCYSIKSQLFSKKHLISPIWRMPGLPGAAWWRQVSAAIIHSFWCFLLSPVENKINCTVKTCSSKTTQYEAVSWDRRRRKKNGQSSVMHHFLSYDECELSPSGRRCGAPPLQTSLSRLTFFAFCTLLSNVCVCQSSSHWRQQTRTG